jgi:hypothetical protein
MAEALIAFRDRGKPGVDVSPQEFAGAMLMAGAISDLEALAQIACAWAKAMSKG